MSSDNGSLGECIRTSRALSYDEQASSNNHNNHHENNHHHQDENEHNSNNISSGEPRPRETR